MANQTDAIKGLMTCGRDPRWRLNNLYWIVDEHGQVVPFRMREAQEQFYNDLWYYNVILKARQLGFTTFIDLIGLDMAIFTPNFKMAIIAETKDKGVDIFSNKILFPYNHLPEELKSWCSIVSCSESASGGEITFSNGSSIEVMVTARSGTFQFLHISEYGPVCAKHPAKAKEIKTGSLPAVHEGGIVIIESTAMGKAGNFYDIVKAAEKAKLTGQVLSKQEYKLHFFPWWKNSGYKIETPVVIPERLQKYFEKLKSMGIELTQEQKNWYVITERTQGEDMKAEYPSYPDEAFEVANEGSYYARQFQKIYQDQRITMVPYEEGIPVYTAWDLGISDDTAIWFFQFCGREIRVIDYYENNGEGLGHYAGVLRDKGYRYARHFAPHDIAVKELGTGLSRIEKAREYGISFDRIPTNLDVPAGIEACRDLLYLCWFDEAKTDAGRKCLEGYRKEWDEKGGCYKSYPCHDWTSHGADAFRTMGVAWKMGMVSEFRMGGESSGGRIVSKGGLQRI